MVCSRERTLLCRIVQKAAQRPQGADTPHMNASISSCQDKAPESHPSTSKDIAVSSDVPAGRSHHHTTARARSAPSSSRSTATEKTSLPKPLRHAPSAHRYYALGFPLVCLHYVGAVLPQPAGEAQLVCPPLVCPEHANRRPQGNWNAGYRQGKRLSITNASKTHLPALAPLDASGRANVGDGGRAVKASASYPGALARSTSTVGGRRGFAKSCPGHALCAREHTLSATFTKYEDRKA